MALRPEIQTCKLNDSFIDPVEQGHHGPDLVATQPYILCYVQGNRLSQVSKGPYGKP
jgi:hypothetical protein